MAVSTNSSYYNSLVAGNKGIGGLVSGMDTESLVENLTYGTRAKIAKQYQQRQVLEWKQEAYRSVRNTLVGFQDNYLRSTSKNGIGKTEFFQQWKTSIKNNEDGYISFHSGNTTGTGSVTVDEVKQLATAATYQTKQFTSPLIGNSYRTSPSAYIGQSLTLRLDTGKAYEISLDGLDPSLPSFASDLQNRIDAELGFHYKDDGTQVKLVVVSDVGGKIQLESGTGTNQVQVVYACSALGFAAGDHNRIDVTKTLGQTFTGLTDGNLVFKINGVEFSVTADTQLNRLMNDIKTKANVDLVYDKASQSFLFTARDTGQGSTLTFEDVQGNFLHTWLGVESGKQVISGSKGLTMGGLEWVYDSPMGDDEALINLFYNISSQLGAKPDDPGFVHSLGALTATPLSFDVTVNGIKQTITIDLSTLTAADWDNLWPKDANGAYLAAPPALPTVDPGELEWLSVFAGNIRGTINEKIYDELDAAFPEFNIFVGIDDYNRLAVMVGKRGDYTYQNVTVEVTPCSTLPPLSSDLLASVFPGVTSLPNYTNSQLPKLDTFSGLAATGKFEIQYNGTIYEIDYNASTDTILDVVHQINSKVGSHIAKVVDGKLVIDGSKNTVGTFAVSENATTPLDPSPVLPNSGNFLQFMFGVDEYSVQAKALTGTEKPGTNAIINVNGSNIDIVSTTNNFTINGIGFTVEKTTGDLVWVDSTIPPDPLHGYTFTSKITEPLTITVGTDVDTLVDKITDFVEEYNAIVKILNKALSEDYNRNYQPLTDEQKAEMTEKEIEKWEELAKTGLLRNDSAIRKILSDMRAVWYNTVEAAGIAAFNIGISTQSLFDTESDSSTLDISRSGIMVIDEDLLRSSLEDNLGAVTLLFTDSKTGIAAQLNNALEEATRTTLGKEGSLVRIAGVEDKKYIESSIGKKIENIDEYISRLNLRLENEYNRYWRQFSRLETAISTLNSQSSWLYDMFS